jgi:hypothetical protein
MPWTSLPDDDATPELQRALKRWTDTPTGVPHVIGIMKPSPKALRAVNQVNNAVTFGGSTLGQRTEELIATATSSFNDCFY